MNNLEKLKEIQTKEELYEFLETLSNNKSVLDLVKKSSSLLDLPDDWDDEGAESYSFSTWKISSCFLVLYTEAIYLLTNKQIDLPRIYPGPNGSIDIDWELKSYRMLINIGKEGDKATFYADDNANQTVEGCFNPLSFSIYLLPIPITMESQTKKEEPKRYIKTIDALYMLDLWKAENCR